MTVGICILRVISRRGDDQITWDSQKVEANDPVAVAAIKRAKEVFDSELERGATAFKVEEVIREAEWIISEKCKNEESKKGTAALGVKAKKTVERIYAFDHTIEQIVIVPRVVGG
jgi:hypothetical protein